MADAVVALRAHWDGSALRRGMSQARTDLDALKKKSGEVTSFMAGPLGFLGVSTAVFSLTQRLRDLAEEDRQMRRLVSTVQRFTGTTPDMRELNKVLVDLRRNSMFGDTELAGTLAQLTTQVGSYTKALELLPVVVDVAAGSQKSLAESAKLVANAQAGIIEPLGEYLPQIKVWARENSKLIGTLDAATYAMGELKKATGGQSAAEIESLAGSFKLFGEGLGEFADSVLTDVVKAGPILRVLGDGLDRLAELIREVNQRGLQLTPFSVLGALGMLGSALERPQVPTTNPYGLGDATQLYPYANTPGGRAFDDPVPGAGGKPEKPMGDMMGRYIKQYPIIDPRGPETMREVADQLRVIKTLREEIRDLDVHQIEDTKILASTLQDYMYGAFQSIRQGWQGLVSYMKELLFRELFTNLAALGINAIFGGGGTFTPLGKAIGLGGAASSSASFGASAAAMQQAQWRNMRRVYG